MGKLKSSGGSTSRWPSGQASTSRWPGGQASASRWIYGGSSGAANWRSYPAVGGGGGGGGTPSVLAFDLPLASSIANLATSTITVGSATLAADFIYQAKDATDLGGSGQWVSSEGTSTDLVYGGGVFANESAEAFTATATDRVLYFPNTTPKYWHASGDSTVGDIGSDDAVIEILFAREPRAGSGGAATRGLGNKISGAGAGWKMWSSKSHPFSLILSDGSTSGSVSISTVSCSFNHFNLVHAFLDKSLNGRFCVNGVLYGSVLTMPAGSIGNSEEMQVGTRDGGFNNFNGGIAHLGMWKLAPGTLDNSDTAALTAFSEARTRLLLGLDATTALGTAAPSTWTRASNKIVEKVCVDGSRALYPMGQRTFVPVPQTDRYGSQSASYVHIEDSATNLFTENEDLADAAWTKVGSTAASGRSQPPLQGPNREFRGIVGASGATIVGVHQSPTLTAENYATSFYVTPGTDTWCYIENATLAAGKVWFRLADGAAVVGDQESDIAAASVRQLSSTMYRVQARFLGTVAAHQIGIFAATDSGTDTASGDGASVNIYAGYGQTEVGDRATSLIITEAASATRLADDFQYDPASHWPADSTTGIATVQVNILLDEMPDAADRYALTLSDGTANNRAAHLVDSSGFDEWDVTDGGAAQVAITGGVPRHDRQRHKLVAKYAQNDFGLWVSSSTIGVDISGTYDNDTVYTELQIGADHAQANHLNGWLGALKIYLTDETGAITMADHATIRVSSSAGTSASTTPTKVAGTTTAINLQNFTMPANNRITWTGVATIRVVCEATISSAASGSAEVTFEFAKNGTVTGTSDNNRELAAGGDVGSSSIIDNIELATNDYVEVFCSVDAGTPTVTADPMNIHVQSLA